MVSKRSIKFLIMPISSKNSVVRTVTNIGIRGMHSFIMVMGMNVRLIKSRFSIEEYDLVSNTHLRSICVLMQFNAHEMPFM